MPTSPIRAALRRIVAASALGAALASPAGAAYVVGNWDPPFGTPFPDLGWRGTIRILVPDDCLWLGRGSYANPAACSGPLTVAQATVQFYDLQEVVAPGADPTTAEVLDFTDHVQVSGFHLASRTSFRGFDAFVSGLVPSRDPVLGSTGRSANTAAFGLSFNDDGSETQASLGWTQRRQIDCGAPALTRCLPGKGSGSSSSTPVLGFLLFNDDGTPIVDGDPRSVPEPWPLGLAAVGLATIALRTRSRRSAA